MSETSQNRFSELKGRFYQIVSDPGMLDVNGNLNALKIVLDGLKVGYSSKGKIRPVLMQNRLQRRLWISIAKFRKIPTASYEFLEKLGKDKFLLMDTGCRQVEHRGKSVSFHYEKIIQFLKKERIVLCGDGFLPGKEDIYDFTFSPGPSQLHFAVHELGRNKEYIELQDKLKTVLSRLKALEQLNKEEIVDVKIAMHYFLLSHIVWNEIIRKLKPEKVMLIVHYHKEGMMYSFKMAGIPTVELQHGLIAGEDIFYCIPQSFNAVINKSLFADCIAVFGEYWRKVLLTGCEYKPENIFVLGEYRCRNLDVSADIKNKIEAFTANRKVILFTTQTFLHQYFIDYIQFVLEKGNIKEQGYCIIVKTHPAEKQDLYRSLSFSPDACLIVNAPLDYLFSISSIHISGYSTTLFEALSYDCANYSLWISESADYIQSMVNSRVSVLLMPDQLPFQEAQRITGPDSNTFYQPFNTGVLNSLLSDKS